MTDNDTANMRDQWRPEAAGMHMRADNTEAGKLVRLADVVLWLIEAKELPRKAAVAALCDALESASPAPALFGCRQGNYAATWAGYQPGARHRPRIRIVGNVLAPHAEARLTGLAGAVAMMRRYWTWERWDAVSSDAEAFGHKALPGRDLAVYVTDAAKLWGWGAVTASLPVDAEEWTGERLHQRSEELKRQGVKDHAQRVAKEAGIVAGDPAREMRRRIKAFKDANKASPLPNVRVIGGKRSA